MRKLPPSLRAWAWRGSRADDRDAAGKRFEQRARRGDGLLRAGGDDPQAAFCGHAGAAKDRRGHKRLAAAGMLGGEALTERNADGGERDVQRAGPERIENALLAEEDFFVCRIVEEHGEHRIGGSRSFGRSGSNIAPSAASASARSRGAVPDGEFDARQPASAAP